MNSFIHDEWWMSHDDSRAMHCQSYRYTNICKYRKLSHTALVFSNERQCSRMQCGWINVYIYASLHALHTQIKNSQLHIISLLSGDLLTVHFHIPRVEFEFGTQNKKVSVNQGLPAIPIIPNNDSFQSNITTANPTHHWCKSLLMTSVSITEQM